MKLSVSQQPQAQVSGVTSSSFGFELNAKMYDMVLAKIYKDKHGAIVRELSCNAYDSHVEAGCPEKPFELHLPTWMDKTFYIRDFGTGIPHESFEDIYTNVGKSTKEQSNTQIGAYGLGSKTPFTLADTYVVENYKDNRKTTWACFKSAGKPQVSRVGDETTQEPNGVKVIISFSSDHSSTFQSATVNQLQFFPVKPTLTGADVSWRNIEEFPKDVKYRYLEGLGRSYVVMGNVSYPFDSYEIGRGSSSLNAVTSRPIAIRAELGEVDIPPSRESLELTEKTKAFIHSVADEIAKAYVADYKAEAKQQQTLWDALVWYQRGEHNTQLLGVGLRRGEHRYAKDSFMPSDYVIYSGVPPFKGIGTLLELGHKYGRKTVTCRTSWSPSVINEHTRIYVDDLGVGGKAHLDSQRSHKDLAGRHVYFLRPGGYKKKENIAQECKETLGVLKKIGIPCDLLSNLIGFPVKTAKPKGPAAPRVEPDQVFVPVKAVKHSQRFESYTGTSLPTTGYALEISNYDILLKDGEKLKNPLREAFMDCLSSSGLEVYLVRSKTFKKLKGPKGYADLFPLISAKLIAENRRDMTARLIATKLYRFSTTARHLQTLAEHAPLLYERSGVSREVEVLLRFSRNLPQVSSYESVAESRKGRVIRELAEYTGMYSEPVDTLPYLRKLENYFEVVENELGHIINTVRANPSYADSDLSKTLQYINEKLQRK